MKYLKIKELNYHNSTFKGINPGILGLLTLFCISVYIE